MSKLQERFQVSHWIAEDFAGTLDDSGRAKLLAWRQEFPGNEQEYQNLLKEFQSRKLAHVYSKATVARHWQKFQAKNIRKKKAGVHWYRYAAVVVLLIGIGGIFSRNIFHQHNSFHFPVNPIGVAEGMGRLILSDGQVIPLTDSIELMEEKASAEIRVAGQTIRYGKSEINSIRPEIYNTLVIPRGGEYKIELSDGTRVWLNSETELRYPVNFSDTCRQVFLSGEAYFEVAKNVEKPFIVRTASDIAVRVLGTKFNIACYKEEEQVVMTLAEGSIEAVNTEQRIRLVPNEQLVFNKQECTFTTSKVDASLFCAWKDGKFIFEKQSLEQVMKRLQRWYEMEVFYENEAIKNYRLSGYLLKYEDFSQIVRMIEEVAGLRISIQNKCVVIGAK